MVIRLALTSFLIALLCVFLGCVPPQSNTLSSSNSMEQIRKSVDLLASEEFDAFSLMTDKGMRMYMDSLGNSYIYDLFGRNTFGQSNHLISEANHFCEIYRNDGKFERDRARAYLKALGEDKNFVLHPYLPFPNSSAIRSINKKTEFSFTVEFEPAALGSQDFVLQDGKWMFDGFSKELE